MNKLVKVKPLMENLSRNCKSSLQKLDLSQNLYEMHDFNEILRILDQDSVFAKRQYFKLRYLNISCCENLSPFEFKLKSKLDEFYQNNKRKLYIAYKTK